MRVLWLVLLLAILAAAEAFGANGANLPEPVSMVHSLDWPAYEGESKTITITKSTSKIFRFPRSLIRAAVSNTDICDITTIGNSDILVNAKEAGVANLIVWDDGNNIATFKLESIVDVEQLRRILHGVDSKSDLQIVPYGKSAAVYGTTDTSLELKQLTEAAKAFDPNVISFVRLRESKQILLEVRFAEVNRKAAKDFKLDTEYLTRFNFFGNFTGQTGESTKTRRDEFTPGNSVVSYALAPLGSESVGNLYLTYFSRGIGLQNFLKWLEQKNILKFIARPNLVTKDGEEAEFNVGGEFPVPVSSGLSGTSISYKEFGTRLKFTPEVLDDDLIRLKIAAEISELDFSTTVTTGGVSVPALSTRMEKTVTELRENQTLVIGGLITQKISRVDRKVPFLGDMPLLGGLFNAHEFSRTDVELLVVVTPHIVRPVDLGETKTLYSAEEVKNAVRIFHPPYLDQQADVINKMITQGETYRDFDKEKKNVNQFMASVSKRMKQTDREASRSETADRSAPPLKRSPTTNFTPKKR